MGKIRLKLDALEVVSFTTDAEPGVPRGTVHGHHDRTEVKPTIDLCDTFTIDHHNSCYGMCRTNEYETCLDAGPSQGPSCDYECLDFTVGCYPPETGTC